ARRLRTSDVGQLAALGKHAPQAAVHGVPGAHVPGFLLDPAHLPRIRVGGEDRLQLLARERIELLDPHDGDRVVVALAAAGEELVVDLAAAEQDAAHARPLDPDAGLRRAFDRHVVDDGPERALGELAEPRHRQLVTQQALWAYHVQGIAE